MNLLHKELSSDVIRIFYEVYNELGYGFLEKVYQNAMYIELLKSGYNIEAQKKINVIYKSQIVGEYYADIIVENKIIIELKANQGLSEENESQLINYLKSSKIEIGLLLNFGFKPEFKRLIFTNNIKL